MHLEQQIRRVLKDGKLPCAVAFEVAQEQSISPGDIGKLANELGIRVSHCQLGLFGYGPKAEGKHKIVKPAQEVSEDMKASLEARAPDGTITCADIWAVAREMGVSKMAASAAVETLGFRVTDCQLHCF